ncbi:MAG: peptide deformylase [Chitinispirillales bacterium]|nr:peptide deformylase [Chitinispirillales bacterium]
MLKLHCYGEPVLRKTAAPVEKFDEELGDLAAAMLETMRREDGVGLAAPQVGVSVRLIVIDTGSGAPEEPYVLANPEIIEASDEKMTEDEGCLSLPGITFTVTRPARVTVSAQNEKGEPCVIKDAEGLLSKALQHELDHLNGILSVDHVSSIQRTLLRGKLKKIKERHG